MKLFAKDLKAGVLVSIPFSAGQRLKQKPGKYAYFRVNLVSIPFSAGQRLKQ